MGQALCSCGGRGDELAAGRALALNAGGERHLHARNAKAVPLAIAAKYSSLVGANVGFQLTQEQHSRGETFALSDDCRLEEDAREQLRALGPPSAQAIADAFRAKLHEPPLSPRSKFQLLITRLNTGQDSDSDSSESRTCDDDDSDEQEGDRRRRTRREREASLGVGIPAPRRRKGEGCALYTSSFAAAAYAYAASDEDAESLTEEDWKARANPLVTIIVPPGPCGLVLQVDPDAQGRQPPTVDGFVRTYDGMKGTIENSALVRKGSVLCAINDIDVTRMPLKEVIRTLNLSSHLERQFAFRNAYDHTSTL